MTDEECTETDEPEKNGFSLTCQQRRALTLDQNIAVTAGAGTGKTTTLEERYRSILRSNPELGPKNVVVITFTKDATSELQDGIRDVVTEELVSTDEEEEYARWRRAKDNLHDAYIHTIHGFCGRILREFAVEAGLHPEFETLDETDAERLFDTAATTVLDAVGQNTTDDLSNSESPEIDLGLDGEPQYTENVLATDVRRLARLYSRRRLEDVLSSLFGQRPDSVAWATKWASETPDAYVRELAELCPPAVSPQEADALYGRPEIRNALDEIVAFAELEHDIGPGDDYGQKTVERIVDVLTQTEAHTETGTALDRARLFTVICDEVTTGSGSGSLYSSDTYYAGKDDRWAARGLEAEQTRLKEAFQTLIDFLNPEARVLERDIQLAHNEAPYAVSLSRLFRATLDEYERRKDRQNALDYSDLIERAVAFLDDSPAACHELREQFAFIMVDEVQDTDPRQWQVVKRLSGTDAEEFDGQNVFLVGDEKQSIYRFRGADVTQFRSSREELTAANPDGVDADQDLTSNFRTLEEPLCFINELFDRIFRPAGHELDSEEESFSGDAYEPYEAVPQRLSAERTEGTEISGSVEYLFVPETDDDARTFGFPLNATGIDETASKAEREAYAIAARISALFVSDTQVYDSEAEEYVSVQPRHVAMLFRSSTRMQSFERALEEYDIPYTNLAGSGFYETSEIRPLLNLFEVLEDPTADVPLYGVLRSPVFGFTDNALAPLAATDDPLWVELGDASEDLVAARDLIEDWRRRAGLGDAKRVISWSTLLSRMIKDTGYLVSVGADERPQQAIANIEKLRARIRTWEAGSALALSDVIDRIQREREADEDPGEATIPGDIDGVQLRTIHSAKGLQFPVVVVPELSRRINIRPNLPGGHLETIDGEPVLGLKVPSPDDTFDTKASPAYETVTAQHAHEERAEAKRVLYVAATRARDHLILSGLHKANPETDTGLTETADPADAARWSDWVQPLLLTDEEIIDDLAADGSVTRSFGNSTPTIRRPREGVVWRDDTSHDEIPTTIEIDEPPETRPRVRLTATTFRDFVYDLSADRTTEKSSGASGNGSVADERVEAEGITQPAFGDVVHKLCELRLPESEWPDAIRKLTDEPEALTKFDIDLLCDHARSGVAELERIENEFDVEHQLDEFGVAARLSNGSIVGDIDHLSVTSTGYHVVDYKTSDLSVKSVDYLIEYYLPQLETYACGLVQSDSALEYVELSLVFTQEDVVHTTRLTPTEIETLIDRCDDYLLEYRESHHS